MFDPACFELAEYFLEKSATESQKTALAQAVQETVEDFLRDIENEGEPK